MKEIGDRRMLYRQLRDYVAGEIARNVWKPGEPISTEFELVAKHNVSHGTVRKALDLLEADGLIERIQGSGSFVRRPN